MDRKIVAQDSRGYVFMADINDTAVSCSRRQEVYQWCGENGITVEYQGTMAGIDVWRVRDEEQRAWFNLKWS